MSSIVLQFPDREKCTHAIVFDEVAARDLGADEARRRWPRLHGRCGMCGWSGIYYVSVAHYVAGDW